MTHTGKRGGIYQIRNVHNNSIYIGSAVCLARRRREHFGSLKAGRHYNKPLSRAYAKYGDGSLTFEVIEYVDNPALLVEREQHWIDTLRPRYNAAPKAGSTLGYRYTPEQRAKLREAQIRYARKNPRTPEFCARMSAARKGQSFSESHLANIRRAVALTKGIPRTSEVRAKLSEAILRRNSTPERLAEDAKRDQEIVSIRRRGKTISEVAKATGWSQHVVSRAIARYAPELQRKRVDRRSGSGRKGVLWHKRNARWVAYVYLPGGRTRYLGCFLNIESAVAAQDQCGGVVLA